MATGDHELPSEQRANVVSGKHSIFTHFPKDEKLRYLLEDQDYKGFLQNHLGQVFLDRDVCRLLQLGFRRMKQGCDFQVDVHAHEISVHLWGVSHRRRSSLLCRGHRSCYDGHARQEAVRGRTCVRAAAQAFCGEPRRVNGKPLHRARFEHTWTHRRHLRGRDAVGSGPLAKPGNHAHCQRPGSHFTVSGFADIAGTSSQDRLPH